jgi:ABC-type cobalamin/Fe3+-siderophores transport system ATPase subunit
LYLQELPRNNPFSSDRVLAIGYIHSEGNWNNLLKRAKDLNYRVAIVGPKGSGKTTLIKGLARRLPRIGFKPVLLSGKKIGSIGLFSLLGPNPIIDSGEELFLLIDEADMLPAFRKLLIRIMAGRWGGIAMACHKGRFLPTLCVTGPDIEILRKALNELVGKDAAKDIWPMAQSIYKARNGDMRETFRDLYDIYSLGI